MLLTDHVQAIIKSAKSIVVAGNYPELAPEHLMLALMLDQNDLPKILFERVGVDNPEIVDRLNNYVSKRAYFARGKFSDVRFSTDTIVLMKVAQEEAEKHHRKPQNTKMGSQQKMMQIYMIAMIGVFGLMWPTAMSIYWAVNSLVTIVKTLLVQKIINKKPQEA